MKYNILILFYLALFMQSRATPLIFGQPAGNDSLHTRHQALCRSYDSLLSAAPDTVIPDQAALLRILTSLAGTDRMIIDREWPLVRQTYDSLVRIYRLRDAELKQQAARLTRLNNTLMFAWLLSGGLLVLSLAFLLAWWRRGSRARKNAAQVMNSEKLILEYRKRLNEIQSALDNCRTQAKMIVTENSRLEREIQQHTADIQKARDAGWLTQDGQPSLPERLKTAELKLAEEMTKKKILEDELSQLLNKLRGEE